MVSACLAHESLTFKVGVQNARQIQKTNYLWINKAYWVKTTKQPPESYSGRSLPQAWLEPAIQCSPVVLLCCNTDSSNNYDAVLRTTLYSKCCPAIRSILTPVVMSHLSRRFSSISPQWFAYLKCYAWKSPLNKSEYDERRINIHS